MRKDAVSENPKEKGILRQLCDEKLNTEDKIEDILTKDEVLHFVNFLFPVHVFGYNWLEDNAVSAAKLVKYIDDVIYDYPRMAILLVKSTLMKRCGGDFMSQILSIKKS